MAKTPNGTDVGVADPYDHVDRCDHLTDDGRCRYAIEHAARDPSFARERRAEEYRCLAVPPSESDANSDAIEWRSCPHFRCRNRDRECSRCGLEERREAHADSRPLLEEHHLSYASESAHPASKADPTADQLSHEITIYLCRWCHAKIHNSWARVADDVNPDPEALAAREERRSREQAELAFESAADRYDIE
ncbi:hypothetical protein Halru_1883 [Halovivax ruber XH-70]|uniref:Uncharacterized protein n=1 Tax=Halovivax ruber (strain DSM 18193 / JCM 13892 / XH-70) TaxID=797302 RepID=L0IET8_HALRX|nr:hypothetical protein [Halovivax ruber]AGB16482.1 hypothetical protein Halru_1883 [Halovivax ruber XH-70]